MTVDENTATERDPLPLHRTETTRQRLRRQLTQRAHQLKSSIREEARQGLRRVRKVPRWVRILRTVYHDYGLKHVCLILILVIYQFLGAAVFYACEAGFDESKEQTWKYNIRQNRTKFVGEIVPLMFNNSDYLFFLTQEQTEEVSNKLLGEIARYETQLGIKYTDQKIKWDFWNAMLYAQTICTTIGYGHLYPSTNWGRIFTMIYAIFGIPLVLSILDDLGKLLTRCLKTPWWWFKCGCRRAFRYFTKQTLEEIRKLDEEDKRDLEIFDLPIPIAIMVVVSWIFICSATFCLWEHDWDYFLAFYFFFISLSTIGLGDITPTQPKYLLMLFIYIIVGLSLVSMCINLIQAKLERTYEAGRDQEFYLDRHGGILYDCGGTGKQRQVQRRGSALGVFHSSSSAHSLNKETIQAHLMNRKKQNKTCQTVLSFPSPSTSNVALAKSVYSSKMKFLPRTLSIDDVMKLVDTEEGDILVLTQLNRDESGISETSNTNSDISGSQIVLSKSFDVNFTPVRKQAEGVVALPSHPSLHDIEAIEELEDRIALGQATQMSAAVHFRSRLSLIPEQHSVIDEVDGEDSSDDSRSPTPDIEVVNSPPVRKRAEVRRSFFSGLLRRKSDRSKDPSSAQPVLG